MPLPFRVPRLKTCLRIAVLAALVAFLVVFDWNWFREPLTGYLAETSERLVRIDDLQVSIDTSLEPTVHLRGVQIDNARWADTHRPLAAAAELAFTFSWRSLVERRPVVSKLRLVDADIDLERRADGLRNWRLRSPEDREPGWVKVLSLEAERTRIRFLHQALALDMTAVASDAATPVALARHPTVMTQQIEVDGHYRDTDFSGRVQAGPLLTFLETGTAFPLRGHVAAGQARLEFEGTVADLFDPATVDASLRLSGSDLARLGTALSLPLPSTPPYAAQAELHKDKLLSDYNFSALRAAIGPSAVTGTLDYDPAGDHPVLRATLAGDRVRQADLVPKPAAGEATPPRPAEPIDAAGWRRLDAHVELNLKSFQTDGRLPLLLQNLRVTAHLEDGALEVAPLHFNLAGGQAVARLALDTRGEHPVGEAELTLRQLRLEKLLPDQPENAKLAGPLYARLRLKGQGRSLADLLGSADGSGELTVEGGSLASTLEAKLAMDGGKLLRDLFTGERPVALRCAVLAVGFKQGQGTARQVWLETEHTQTRGSGRIDLRTEDYELLLAPHSKDNPLLALNKPLRVHGSSFTDTPQVDLGTGGTAAPGAPGCKLLKAPAAED